MTTPLITVDGATVIRQDELRGCRLTSPTGDVFQVPKVYRWLFVMQHRKPGHRDARLRCYEIGQN